MKQAILRADLDDDDTSEDSTPKQSDKRRQIESDSKRDPYNWKIQARE